MEVGTEPVPGIRSQIAAVDYFGGGKMDLLVGDFCTAFTLRADLTPAERLEFQSLREQVKNTEAERSELFGALREESTKRFPGDAQFTSEAAAAFKTAVRAMHDSPRYKSLEKRLEELDAAGSTYLFQAGRRASTQNPGQYAAPHGYVWLFQRK